MTFDEQHDKSHDLLDWSVRWFWGSMLYLIALIPSIFSNNIRLVIIFAILSVGCRAIGTVCLVRGMKLHP